MKFCGGSERLHCLGLEALSRIWEQCYSKEGGSGKHFDLGLMSHSPRDLWLYLHL